MSLMQMTMKHGRTRAEARTAAEQAVRDLQARFGRLVRRATWDPAGDHVRIDGIGFWAEIRVDDAEVHVTGDVPALGGLLGSPLGVGIKQVVQRSFARALPGRTTT